MPVKETSLIKHNTWLEIELDKLSENFNILQNLSSHAPDVLAVIKANAYGHGSVEVARALDTKTSYLGVASLREAFELKEQNIKTPVFLFGRLFKNEIAAALIDGITLSVSSLEEAKEISELSETLKRKTPIHIKVDTGMGRLGMSLENAQNVIEKIASLKNLYLEGIYTHLPTAEQDNFFRESQIRDFSLLIEDLEKKNIVFKFRHIANSAGSLSIKSPVFNMIRPGLTLFGIYPDFSIPKTEDFSPILSLKSRIIFLKRMKPGETVGYGRKFTVKEETTIAILPIGYSHGYPYTIWDKASALYNGKRYKIAGHISMDYVAINLENAPAKEGDVITLIGRDGNDIISVEEIAEWANTIPYEILTRLSPTLPKIYTSNS